MPRKIIDTWKIRKNGLEHRITVRMDRDDRDVGRATRYIATCQELELKEENTNLDELEKVVRKKLETLTAPKWERWLQVTIKQNNTGQRGEALAGLTVTMSRLERCDVGTTSERHRDCDENWKPYDNGRVSHGAPDEGPQRDFSFDHHDEEPITGMCAMVPHTNEAEQAVKAVQDKLAELGARMLALFEPSTITNTLEAINKGTSPLALPAPPKAGKAARR